MVNHIQSRVAIIADTDCSLPADVAAQHGIRLVPISVHFGTETFETGIDIDDAQLFARIDRENKLPTTSAPAPAQFVQAYQAAFDQGADAVICFCVSSEVSATYHAALTACESFPGHDISVVDTRMLSMAQGFIVMEAARAVQAGAGKEAAIERVNALRERTHLYGALSTLKYLAMSGRVGHVAASMANLLQFKPILTIKEGKLDMLEKVRTQKKAWERLIELTEQSLAGRPCVQMSIIHTCAAGQAREFEVMVRARLSCPPEILIAEVTPGLSVHTGAGLIGLAVIGQ